MNHNNNLRNNQKAKKTQLKNTVIKLNSLRFKFKINKKNYNKSRLLINNKKRSVKR